MKDEHGNPMTAATGHPADLHAYVAGRLEADAVRGVEAHLDACRECRDEAEALASMRDTLNWYAADDHLPARNSWKAAFVAAAAVLLGVAVIMVEMSRRPTEVALQSSPSVVLASPQRSGGTPAELRGAGPWHVIVVLPFTAPEGTYLARVHEGRRILAEAVAASDRDRRVELQLQGLPEAGSYELVLELLDTPGTERHVFPFSVRETPAED